MKREEGSIQVIGNPRNFFQLAWLRLFDRSGGDHGIIVF